MRILFLLLVLLNAAFFAWYSRDRDGPSEPHAGPAVAADKRLVLLSERPLSGEPPGGAAPRPRQQEPPEQRARQQARPDGERAASSGTSQHCYEAGPFASEAEAQRFLRARILGGRAEPAAHEVVARDSRERAGLWVRWPGALPLAEARRLYRELRAKGVEDIAITPTGEGDYYISLGVFRREDTLLQRRERLAALGYETEVVERNRTVPRYWVVTKFNAPFNAPVEAPPDAPAWQAVACP